MKGIQLTKNEEKVLYGLVRYPELNDSELSSVLNVKFSTLTSIKRRLGTQGLFRTLTIPMVNRLGCELLAVIYTQFNPVIPLEERIETTKRNIEIFDEIFFSVGEQEKGFSISLSKNYTTIGRINEIRTETFGKLGLLEKEYPHEVIFPFETSQIMRFFDYTHVLKKIFAVDIVEETARDVAWFRDVKHTKLSPKERRVYAALVERPDATTQQIGKRVGLSRHTIARMKKQFFDDGLLKQMVLPALSRLGVEILAFYHIKFNPHKAPSMADITYLDSPFTILLASRKFEMVILAAYPNYQDYKEDEMSKIRFLKENDLISYPPLVATYMFDRMVIIKDFDFAPFTKKIVAVS